MTYKLKSLDISTGGWPHTALLLKDGSKPNAKQPINKSELQAQVASGDYLSLLATRLDQVSQSLRETSQSDYIILENTIEELLYLQHHYTLAKPQASRG